ncbi:Hypp9104 [Branchiostoma lanceolatum]|uniref:Hypp9104 protein n=1 Tax=Branchiostoma lanceolatum TaxID=7740 RepID=A0A8J9ZDR5_BRALA|nr:Hypp9104 [Branchiostoma lanceolatum]
MKAALAIFLGLLACSQAMELSRLSILPWNDGNGGIACTMVYCFVDPCMMATCPEGTTCRSNYCNGCNADCVNSDNGLQDLFETLG